MNEEDLHRMSPDCGEDAAAYVLGALTEEEQAVFQEHLESCAVCRDEVTALESVASVLPAAVPQVRAPGDIKRRVMATVNSEAGLRAAREPAVQSRRRRTARSGRYGWRSALLPVGALAAVAIAIVLISSGSSGGGSSRVIQAQVSAPHAAVSVRLNGSHAELNVAGMPQSPPNHVYQVWVKRGGAPQPTDALFTVSSTGRATVGVPGSVAGVKQILVTAEPTGGSRMPTSPPVIVANVG